jgi:hypothetical protein
MIICKHGLQMSPEGESGIYFICQYEWERKGSHCRFARWCSEIKKYTDSTGKLSCPHFKRVANENPHVKSLKNKDADKVLSSSSRKTSSSDIEDKKSDEDDKKSSDKSKDDNKSSYSKRTYKKKSS